MRSKVTLFALTAGVTLALTAPAAFADKITATIDSDAASQGRYSGKVKTKKDKCAKRRTVEVYDQTTGEFFIGSTRTNGKGRYELFEFIPEPGQQVRVVAPRAKGCPTVSTIAAVPEDAAVP